MPYTRFVKRGGEVDVYKRTPSGREVKAFTSHSPSLEEAHRKAAIRERHVAGMMKNRRGLKSRR
jgi:hypothetical protein